MDKNVITIKINHLLEKEAASENDLLIIQDDENTKQINIRNLIASIVKDNEVPTSHRIYSALKVQNMLDESAESIGDTVDAALRKIATFDTEKVDVEDVDIIVAELKELIDTKADDLKVDEGLALKRNKADKITKNDLETSNDSLKLGLENFSQEVLDYMTGAVVIPTNRAPIGGWRREDLADNAINFKKLDQNYSFYGLFNEGSTNEMVDEGTYLLGNGVDNMPALDENDTEIKILTVVRADEQIIQTVQYVNDLKDRPFFKRKSHMDRLHVADWIVTYEISDKFRITRDMLADVYGNNGELNSNSVFSLRAEGTYYAKSTVTNLPSTDDYMVKVEKYGDRFLFTATKLTNDACQVYESVVYFTQGLMPVNTPWYNTSTTTRSKFDGKSVFLFGDGIMFGLKSTDIPNKSIPGILSNKYGMSINNRSTGDATFGHYDDEYLVERSILTQIDNAPMDDADYAILFAGTNDWKVGKAVIGKDTDKTDTTFKGAINLALEKILTKKPSIKIMLATPLFRARINIGDNRNSDTNKVNDRALRDYSNAIKEVCAYHHIPVLDLLDSCMINQFNHTEYLADGLYPNDKGYAMLADKFLNGMSLYY